MFEHVLLIVGVTLIAFGLFLVADQAQAWPRRGSPLRRWLSHSLVFGLLVVFNISYGHQIRPGVIIDARGAVLALATIAGGYGVGVATAIIALLTRLSVGGVGMWAGSVGIGLDLAVAVLLVRLWQHRRSTWAEQITLLVLCGIGVGCIEALSLRWVGPADTGMALFHTAGMDVFVAHVLCTLLMGSLIYLQQESQRSRQTVQAALATAMDGFALIGADGRLRETNPALEAMTGYSRAELLQMGLDQLQVGTSAAAVGAWIEALHARGQSRFGSRWRRRDGSLMELDGAAIAAPEVPGAVYAFVRDITARKQGEAELERRLGHQRALTAISAILRQGRTAAAGLDEVARVLLEASGMDHCYIIENHRDHERGVSAGRVSAAVREGITAQAGNPELLRAPYPAAVSSGFLRERFLKREACRGPIREWPAPEREFMASQGIQDAVILPIYAGDQFWGLVGIDDCTTVGRSDDHDVTLLQNAAEVIGWHLAVARETAALAESQRSLGTLMGNLPGLAYRRRHEPAWTMEFVSDGCRALTGYSPAELVGNARLSFAEVIHAEDRPAVWSQVQGALDQRQHYQITYRITTAGGETRWVWEQGLGVYAPAGNLLALEGFILDVTAERIAEANLAKYRLLSESANDIILFVRPDDGHILEANRAACDTYGYERAELLKRTIVDLRADPDASVAQQLQQAARGGVLFETRHVRRDGSTFPVEVSSRAAHIGGGAVLLSVVRDLTARKRLEEELRQLNADLERRVQERTAEALDIITARECLEVTLRESEEKYRVLFERSRDAIITADATGRVLDCNPAAAALYGYPNREALQARGLAELNPERQPDGRLSREVFGLKMAELLTQGSIFFDWQHRHADGTEFPAEISVSAVEVRGQPVLFGVVRNITQRKQIEAELRASEGKFRHLMEMVPIPIVVVNQNGVVTFLNARFVQTLGYDRADIPTAAEWWRLAYPDPAYRQPALELWDKAVATAARDGSDVAPQEHQITCKDGTVRTIVTSGIMLGTDLLATFTDITRLQQATENLRTLSQAVGFSPAMIVITDPLGRVEYVNPAWERVTGYRLADVVGAKPRALKSGVHPPEFYAQMWSEITSGRVWRGQFCNRRKSGELYWESAAIAPVHNDAGTLTHFVAIKEDITAARQAAEELRQAKDAAESANRAKSVFLANMSHEIRTPMNAILGFSQLLLREPGLSAQQKQPLTTIARSGEHLLDIINDILEMARIESGRVSLNPVTFDLHLLLEEVERLFSLRAEASKLRFTVDRRSVLPRWVLGDESRLRQVIINLVGNAVKFTPHGGEVILRVCAEGEADGGWRLEVEVADTGIGIAPADLPKLFRPFSQTGTGKHVSGGTGLGLAISREFVRLLGGDLTVSSQLGQGSVFRFSARLARAVAGAAAAAAAAAAAPAPRVLRLLPGLPACRILVADDEQDNRNLLEQVLAPIGFEVRTAVDGMDAVAQCQTWCPQVVLLDLRMPVLDGYEAARRIRGAQGTAVKIIALSATVFAESQEQVLAAGADRFIGKPFREADLLEQIKDLTGVNYVYADPAAQETEAPEGAAAERPTAAEIQALPADLVRRLRDTVAEADFDQMLALTAAIAALDEALGRKLRRLVEHYEYNALLAILSATP